MKPSFKIAALAAGLVFSVGAQAHPGLHFHGFGSGFAHPLMGADHLLAMVAIGLWAAQQGGRHLLALPVAFVLSMAAGVALGSLGLSLPGIDAAALATALVLCSFLAFAVRMALTPALALVAGIALVHGYAHGVELPAYGAGLYFAGLLAATACLHAAGVGAAALMKGQPGALRIAGAVLGLAGIAFSFA